MSSGYRVAWATLLVLAACRTSPDPTQASRVPVNNVPIGPIPGPAGDPALPRSPYANDAAGLLDGRRAFERYNCDGCHGGHAGGGIGPSLRDQEWIYGNSDAHVFASIAEGRANGMPASGTMLPEQEIWKLVSYIKSLRTNKEPAPP
jgi:cytochrome c oxidase cbb3-type subunit 3